MTDTDLPLLLVRDAVTGHDSERSPVERLVALAIADHMGTKDTSWPSYARLAAWTGLGMTAVRAAVATLCTGPDAVFYRVEGGARPGQRYASNRYTLTEHVATRGARQLRGSAGDIKGIATRARGYRHTTQNDSLNDSGNDSTRRPEKSLSADGTLDRLTALTDVSSLRSVAR